MTSIPSTPNPNARLHLIFVPGFGGFDALGQIEYYAGTTHVFQAWLKGRQGNAGAAWGDRVVLHYAPTIPTAGVSTRAEILLRFLTKRIYRRAIQGDDRIALIGHSTGGLDIRQLILELSERGDGPLSAHGCEDHMGADPLPASDLLKRIQRVVFLSVPQRGTNIANWVIAHSLARHFLTFFARFGVDALDIPGVDLFTSRLGMALNRARELGPVMWLGDTVPDVLLAAADAAAEVSQRTSADPVAAALGRAALHQLNLWLSHTHGDTLALHDLAAAPGRACGFGRLRRPLAAFASLAYRASRLEIRGCREDVTNLARREDDLRNRETQLWREKGILVRSYATRSPAPFGPPACHGRLSSWQRVACNGLRYRSGTDLAYRVSHTACASGPFASAQSERLATSFSDGKPVYLDSWENDGIVNTASMLWPSGHDTLLIDGDHGDVVGHYHSVRHDHGDGRRYDAYDILKSGAGFDDGRFRQVWNSVFTFCCE